jgi:spore germination protein YaaH
MPRARRKRRRLLLFVASLFLLTLLVLYFRCGRSPGPVSAGPPPLAPPIAAQRDPAIVLRQARAPDEGPCAVVLGFLPHWVDQSNIDYGLLTDIACFAIEFQPDGTVKESNGWPWVHTINRAHAAGVRVHITAQLFGAGDLLRLLTDRAARSRFYHEIGTAAVVAGAEGIVVDFEGDDSTEWTAHMPRLAADLRRYLAREAPNVRLSFAVPAVNWGGRWDFATLADLADHLVIMGYDYEGRWSERAGPSAPLTGRGLNLGRTVEEEYVAAVGERRREKLVLALPHYGNHWLVADRSPRAPAREWVDFVTYSAARRLLERIPPRWDDASQTPYLAWRDERGWNQIWYEDARSFRLKLNLAQRARLGGVGIWALGFAGDHDDLWREIHRVFVAACRCVGDLTGDKRIDGDDLHILIDAYGTSDAGDLNADGVTDQDDLRLLLDNFPGKCEE